MLLFPDLANSYKNAHNQILSISCSQVQLKNCVSYFRVQLVCSLSTDLPKAPHLINLTCFKLHRTHYWGHIEKGIDISKF